MVKSNKKFSDTLMLNTFLYEKQMASSWSPLKTIYVTCNYTTSLWWDHDCLWFFMIETSFSFSTTYNKIILVLKMSCKCILCTLLVPLYNGPAPTDWYQKKAKDLGVEHFCLTIIQKFLTVLKLYEQVRFSCMKGACYWEHNFKQSLFNNDFFNNVSFSKYTRFWPLKTVTKIKVWLDKDCWDVYFLLSLWRFISI